MTNENPHEEISKRAQEIFGERKIEHKQGWRVMPRYSLGYGAIYKVERALANNSNKAKALDDLVDAYNYVAFLFERVSDEV